MEILERMTSGDQRWSIEAVHGKIVMKKFIGEENNMCSEVKF